MDEDSYAKKFVEDEPSFYEKVRSANIAANDAFLKQLGITPLVPPENKKRKRHPIAVQPELGNRKSARNHNTVNQTGALRGDEAEPQDMTVTCKFCSQISFVGSLQSGEAWLVNHLETNATCIAKRNMPEDFVIETIPGKKHCHPPRR